jgi:hypothetical protein
VLKALKRALQEVLGSGRWYGTMPKGCVVVWIIVSKGDREEMIATGELKEKKEEKKEEKKDKSRKERKRMRNYAEALHVPRPWHSLIGKPWKNATTKITTKITCTTKRNANTTKGDTPTLLPGLHRGKERLSSSVCVDRLDKGITRCSTLLPIRGSAGMPSSLSGYLPLTG